VNFQAIIKSLGAQPGYTLMRGVARFHTMRWLVANARRLGHGRRLQALLRECEVRVRGSVFATLDRTDFVNRLRANGVAQGLMLPTNMVREISTYAELRPCFADRDSKHGFKLEDRPQAEGHLGKPILLAQYFNAAKECPAIARLLEDPVLKWIAGSYLESEPKFVGANLWWTFPVKALAADIDRHAQLYHRDVDDFRFFKYFFYLTDVQPGDGAHVCVIGSHRRPPRFKVADGWNIRRYSDSEIESFFPQNSILEICGMAGTGFAENTLCVHKGRTPVREPRLLLQLQYALFDYGAMHDRRDATMLRLVA